MPDLYEAMSRLDPDTGMPRGFMRLAARTTAESVAFTLDISREDGKWKEADAFLRTEATAVVEVGVAALVGCCYGGSRVNEATCSDGT